MGKYDDIISMPYRKSERKAHMPLKNRAVQFAPFAALKGYEEEIWEQERLTEEEREIDEYLKEEVNEKLKILSENSDIKGRITYFIPDERKDGGRYAEIEGFVKKINEEEGTILFTGKAKIPIDKISEIEIL